MSKVKIICTSTSAIEHAPERYQHYGIEYARVHMTFKGKEYLEGLDLDPVKFYRELEVLEDAKNNLPKTAIPSPIELTELLDKSRNEGYDEFLVFTISSGISGAFTTFTATAERYMEEHPEIKIHVIDTKVASFSEGYHAIRAAEWLREGKSVEEVIKETEWAIKHQLLIGVDGKLDYLIYNGRLKGGKAFIGKMLGICPVVEFNEKGELVAVESVRTPKKALVRMCERLKRIIGDRKPEDYMLCHIFTGESLIAKLREMEGELGIETNHEPVIMNPTSGCHNGPWLAGYCLYFIRRPDEPLE